MRQIYENDATREVQQDIANRIEKALKCKLVKLRALHRLDYSAERDNRILAYIEIKRRYRTFSQYPNTYLSLHKVEKAREVYEKHTLPCIFFVQFDDCLAYADMLPERDTATGGRYDRNDPWDVERLVLIPMSEFTKV